MQPYAWGLAQRALSVKMKFAISGQRVLRQTRWSWEMSVSSPAPLLTHHDLPFSCIGALFDKYQLDSEGRTRFDTDD